MKNIGLFLFLLPIKIYCSVESRQNVTLGLVYQNYAHSKVYDKAFKETIRNINIGQSISLLKKLPLRYELVPLECVLPKGKFFPSDVLHCLCEVISRVSVIIFVTASEEYDGILDDPFKFVCFRKYRVCTVFFAYGESDGDSDYCLER
jgi:hypothetical protein